MGIWATCARRMEGRATEELKVMFEEVSLSPSLVDWTDSNQCAERFYGLKSDSDKPEEDSEFVEDIEASIQKEVESIDTKKGSTKLFSPVHLDIECVLFFQTQPPIDPVDFVHRICKEVASKPDIRRTRYVNRLTPVTIIGKATDKGIEEVGKTVLGSCFQLAGDELDEGHQDEAQKRNPFSVRTAPPYELLGIKKLGLQPRAVGQILDRAEPVTTILLGNC